MNIARFQKKPIVIEATIVTHEEEGAIAEWCGGQLGTSSGIYISTLEGLMYAAVGDWVIKGIEGEFYPCKPEIFRKSYEQWPNEHDCDGPGCWTCFPESMGK